MDPRYQKAREELAAWQQVCEELKQLEAVTEQDLKSQLHLSETPGQRLLTTLRQWGEAKTAMHQSETPASEMPGFDPQRTKMKAVYMLAEGMSKPVFRRIGVGVLNPDGTLDISLDALPVTGRLHVRDLVTAQETEPKVSNETSAVP